MDADRIEGALAALDPEARALVELSLIRDVADEDIAGILGTDIDAVRIARADALVTLAEDLGASSGEEVGALVHDMRELPSVRWRDEGEVRHAPELPPQHPDPPAAPPPPAAQPGARRRRRLRPALLGGILVAAVVALVLALSSGEDDDGGGDQPAEPASPTAGGSARLTPPSGGTGKGEARLTGDKLEVSASGLPDPGGAGYVVWLYNSLSDARPLTRPQRFEKGFDVKAALPQNADRYRFVDVSLELEDDNRNHSGESMLRVPLSKLR